MRNRLQEYVDSRLHLVRAEIYLAADEAELATRELENALRLDPGSGAAKARLASRLQQLSAEASFSRNHERALVWLLHEAELYPERMRIHRDIANTYMALGRQEEAIPHVRVKPAILGGVHLKAGDTVYDGTLRRRIKQLRRQLVSAELPAGVFGASES